jgi:hypothetical protein
MITRLGGLKIWGHDGQQIRVFLVAIPDEQAALERVKSARPGLTIMSRHWMYRDTLDAIELPQGTATELVHIEPKQSFTDYGGEPIDKPLPIPKG